MANYGVEGLSNNENEQEWLTVFDEFKAQFPESKLTPILASEIKKVELYHVNLARGNAGVEILGDVSASGSLVERYA